MGGVRRSHGLAVRGAQGGGWWRGVCVVRPAVLWMFMAKKAPAVLRDGHGRGAMCGGVAFPLRRLAALPPFFVEFYEQQSDGRPYQFAYAHYQGDQYSGVGREGEALGRHEETALAAPELQRHEEQHIGEQ